MMFRPPVSGSPHSASPPWPASAGPAPQTGGTGSGAPGGTGPGAPAGHDPGPFPRPPIPAVGPMAVPVVRSRRAPVVMLVIGAVMLLAAIVVAIASVGSLLALSSSLVRINGTGTTTMTLEADSDYGLYHNGMSTSCDVTGPDGQDVPLAFPGSRINVDDQILFGTFTTTASGDYEISCTTFGYAGPLPSDSDDVHDIKVSIGDAVDVGSLASRIIITIGSILIGIIGVVLLIAGLIWLLVRTSGNKKARQAQLAADGIGVGRS